jgi:1,4-alpha-glucan branching enzyme
MHRRMPNLTPAEVDRILAVEHADPHTVLGQHIVERDGRKVVAVRVFRPDAHRVRIIPDAPEALAEDAAHPRVHEIPPREALQVKGGLFEAIFDREEEVFPYLVDVEYEGGARFQQRDGYAFLPTLGEIDQHLLAEGRHLRLYEKLGAHPRTIDGVDGVSFAVWAPQAKRVSVVGAFNRWDGRLHAMRRLTPNGIWELFVPDIGPRLEGGTYKFEILSERGRRFLKTDPLAFETELRPDTAGVIRGLRPYTWHDDDWVAARAAGEPLEKPWAIYEAHLGGFMRVPEEKGAGAIEHADGSHTGRWLTYRELADKLVAHVKAMGFTHVELMPITEYPYDGSWGYQCTGYFSPTKRHGAPEDLKYLIDELHRAGVGVILDWVPAHFPRDAHGLRRFDGSAVYEHIDPRQGEHADWGTMVFNYGRPEVKNFLLASALYWLREFHFDGLRVDAVASMLYLDYSRNDGGWVANKFGGRENLEAIEFLRELNEVVHREVPGAVVIAEESTAWPAVSRPTYVGGLGFTFKWNMGWMHDTLAYFSMDSIFRSHHHDKVTFGLWYAWSENFVLPLSHDEVVHMKGSLLGKMPGDPWRKFANLRALYAHMWAHPGKKLLFMGAELAQIREFSEERSLDWHLLQDPLHAGVNALLKRLNALYQRFPALWEADVIPDGFRWIDANDNAQSVASFVRFPKPRPQGEAPRARDRAVVSVLNATPVVREAYRLGVPYPGHYELAINTDDADLGGSGVKAFEGFAIEAEPIASHGFEQSIVLKIPPLSVVWLVSPVPPVAEVHAVEARELPLSELPGEPPIDPA